MDNLKKLVTTLREKQQKEEQIVELVELLTRTAAVRAMARVAEALGAAEESGSLGDIDGEGPEAEAKVKAIYEQRTGQKVDDLVMEEMDKLAQEYLLKKSQPQA